MDNTGKEANLAPPDAPLQAASLEAAPLEIGLDAEDVPPPQARVRQWEQAWQRLQAKAITVRFSDEQAAVYAVSDPHLGARQGDYRLLLRQLEALPLPAHLLLLGDVGQVWLAPPACRAASERVFWEGLCALRDGGLNIVCVMGNRDFLLPRKPEQWQRWGLPFSQVVRDAALWPWRGRHYGLTHGDLVQREDKLHLHWRRLCRSSWTEAGFQALPSPWMTALAARLERAMLHSNQRFAVHYPAEVIACYARFMLKTLDGYFMGHFHVDRRWEPYPDKVLRILPAWLDSQRVEMLFPPRSNEAAPALPGCRYPPPG